MKEPEKPAEAEAAAGTDATAEGEKAEGAESEDKKAAEEKK